MMIGETGIGETEEEMTRMLEMMLVVGLKAWQRVKQDLCRWTFR